MWDILEHRVEHPRVHNYLTINAHQEGQRMMILDELQ